MLNEMCKNCIRKFNGKCNGTECETWTGCALKEEVINYRLAPWLSGAELRERIFADLRRLSQLEEIANHAESDYEGNPENEEFEIIFNLAYENQWNQMMKVVSEICEFSKLDKKTVRELICTKRNELLKLFSV